MMHNEIRFGPQRFGDGSLCIMNCALKAVYPDGLNAVEIPDRTRIQEAYLAELRDIRDLDPHV